METSKNFGHNFVLGRKK